MRNIEYYINKWDDEACELFAKRRIRRNYFVSSWQDRFSSKDTFALAANSNSRNYGVSTKQYNVNGHCDGVNYKRERFDDE